MVPEYVVSIDGVFRLWLLKHFRPKEWEGARELILKGVWHVAGPLWEATDCLVPSPESLIRHVALGQRFLEQELGLDPRCCLLPDCFGFPASMPTILAHCGVRSFLTQKLIRGSHLRAAVGVPFPVGWWQGPDGSKVLAVLEPGDYGDRLVGPVQQRADVLARLRTQAQAGGNGVVMLVGVGDTGGASDLETLQHLRASIESGEAPVVCHQGAEPTFDELALQPDLPTWRDELLLNLHGSGCYTSKVGMKRWNAVGQRLAKTAEAVALAATQAELMPWPERELEAAWQRLLWHQFHDDLTGTSTLGAYEYSWHDEAVASSLLAGVISSRMQALAAQMDLRPVPGRPSGTAFVVFNPVAQRRVDIVELVLPGDAERGEELCAWDGVGEALPCQRVVRDDGRIGMLVRVEAPALGIKTVWVGAGEAAGPRSPVVAEAHALVGERLQLRVDAAGDVVSIHDRDLGELLRAPAGFEVFAHRSRKFPAWEIHAKTLSARPRSRFEGRASIRVVEPGPLRATLEIVRRTRGAVLRHTVSVQAGSGVVRNRLDANWRRRASLLKATFPLTPEPERAIFDGGIGVVERGPNTPSLWEVPAQGWVAAEVGGIGVAIAAEDRYGWDQPHRGHLRLTLVHTPAPGLGRRFRHQGRLDFGEWRTGWSLWGYSGSWQGAGVPAVADGEAGPLMAFRVGSNGGGPLGREVSWLSLPHEVGLMALGREPRHGRPFVRVLERTGSARTVELRGSLAESTLNPIDGCDRPLEEAAVGEQGLKLPAFGCVAMAMGEASVQAGPHGTVWDLPVTRRSDTMEVDDDELDCQGVRFRVIRDGSSPLVLEGSLEWALEEAGVVHVLAVGGSGGGELVIETHDGGATTMRVPDGTAWLAHPGEPGGLWSREVPPQVERTPIAAQLFRRAPDGSREP
ncbi:MAG: hypothetical protein KDB31_04980, partial [Microthrixaceae bacterium]|nr:hypothetical protein [Microthrixaceae bacterium]